MGGFMLFQGGKAVHTLTPEDLELLSDSDNIDFPDITQKEIQDKSKGDFFSKGIVVVQTGWFILQCTARRVEHLSITELEVVTLAFAILNFATYWLWWHKPQNVCCPVRVAAKTVTTFQANTDNVVGRQDHSVWWIIKNTVIGIPHRARTAVDKIVRGGDMVRALSPFNVFAHMAGEDGGHTIPGAQYVPAFYAGELTEEEQKYTSVVGLVAGIVFGAIHCIAWSYQFPSHLEQILWRTSTVAIICTPAAVFSVSMFLPPPPALMALHTIQSKYTIDT
jgi:hypothetical protein